MLFMAVVTSDQHWHKQVVSWV